jgi:long-chain acyl-CoA synthetase
MATASEERSDTQTMGAMVLDAVERFEGAALRYKEGSGWGGGEWEDLSYADLGDKVRRVAKGLIALGIEPGEKVAIFSDTRPEWTLADLGATCAGAVVACIYQTSSAEEARHILENSESRVVFCEGRRQVQRITEIREHLEHLEHVVVFEAAKQRDRDDSEESSDDPPMAFEDFLERGDDVDDDQVRERVDAVDPDDVFTLIYTSGTTGPPKGCILTHANYRINTSMLEQATDLGEDPVFYVFLPLAHTLTRMVQMVALSAGATLAYWTRDKNKLMDELGEVQPTHFPAVPRIFEKIYNQAMAKVPEDGAKRKMFDKAIDVGSKVRDLEREGKSPGPVLKAEYKLADNEFFEDIRGLFGGRLRLAQTGAAPVAQEMLEFFDACGVPIMEGYGATETSAVVSTNTPDALRFGTVGKPLEGCEVKIDEDEGELLVRGPHIFQGYNKDEEETKETLDDEGWLHTGDRGSLDDDGFLSIDGRLKDIIVTSSGKNVAASNIENKLSDSRWISQAVVYGDERPYLVALLTVDPDEREALADKVGMAQGKTGELSSDENVREELQKVVDEANGDFADIEQIKKFAVLDRDLSESEDEVTPTMKVKRQNVYDNHQELFDSLYEDGDSDGGDQGSDDDDGDEDDG